MFSIKQLFKNLLGLKVVPVTILIKHEKSCSDIRCTMWSLKADIDDEDRDLEIVWQRKEKFENTWYDVADDVNPYVFKTFDGVTGSFKVRCKIKRRGFTRKTVEVVIKGG